MGLEFSVLLVEDNASDGWITRDCLEKMGAPIAVRTVRDGEQAWAFVTKAPPFADEPTPHLILMDINLPRRSGLEVLADLKGTAELCRIPVVMLTSTEADEDLLRGYDLHANAFMRKPFALDELRKVLRVLVDFWLLTVIAPSSLQ